MKCKKISIVILVFVFVFIFLISSYILLKDMNELRKNNEATEELIEETIEIKEASKEKYIDWNYLKSINEDIIAWIEIEGTNINYPIIKNENNYYLKILEADGELDTSGEIVEKWNWNGKEYYIQHVNTIQIQINKIHGDAIGGKEVDGKRSIATLTQSVGIPIYDENLRISTDDLKIGDIVELRYIDTSIEQGALSPFKGYEGILLIKEIVKMEDNK